MKGFLAIVVVIVVVLGLIAPPPVGTPTAATTAKNQKINAVQAALIDVGLRLTPWHQQDFFVCKIARNDTLGLTGFGVAGTWFLAHD